MQIVELYQRTEKPGLFRSMLEDSKPRTIGDIHLTKSGKIHVDDRDEQRAKKSEALVDNSWEKMVLVQPGMVEEAKDRDLCGSNQMLTLKLGADEKEEPREYEVRARHRFQCPLEESLNQTGQRWIWMTRLWNT